MALIVIHIEMTVWCILMLHETGASDKIVASNRNQRKSHQVKAKKEALPVRKEGIERYKRLRSSLSELR